MRRSDRRRAAIACALASLSFRVAQAEIRVDIEGVDGDLKRNITATLSVERYKDRERIEADAVERLFRRVDDEVRSALRPFGYYQPQVDASLETLEKEKKWRVHVAVTPGPPVIVDEVSIVVTGPGADEEHFRALTTSPPIRSGDQLNHRTYDQTKAALQRIASTYGFLDARMLRSELQVDEGELKARIYLAIETGERYRFGATTIEQKAIRDQQVRRYLRYTEGEPYDATLWLRTQFALDDSQYFSNVVVALGERDTVHHVVPIDIHADPARRSYPIAVGYGTDDGAHGSVSWFNPRINGLGHRMQAQLKVSQIKQTFNTRYDIPFGDPALEKMSLVFTVEDAIVNPTADDNEQVRTSEISLTPSVTQVRGRWQRVLSVTAEHTVTRDPANGRQVDNLIVPGLTYASVPEGYLGENLFSRALYIELLGSHTALGANANFVRADLQVERSFNIVPLWHLLTRGQVGASVVSNKEDLPGQYRFFAGGDRSVRGFSLNELSPIRDVNGVPQKLGGRHLLTGTLEVQRDLPRNFGLATFFDFGNALDSFNDPLAYSVGVGFRWRLPGITLGVDIAQALHAPGEATLPGPRLHLNISPTL
jgi:translocation and assembly module TamA